MGPEPESANLRLRQWREGDVEGLFKLHENEISEETQMPRFDREEIWRRIASFIGHWELRGFGPWALEEKQSRSFVGFCGLWFPSGWQDIEIGYAVTPQHRRKGYATEAALHTKQYGYGEKAIPRLVSYIRPDNVASQGVAAKLGAVREGNILLRGKPCLV